MFIRKSDNQMDKKQAKILVIESQQKLAETIKNDLADQGYSVSTSVSAESGLLRAKAFKFDFFIVNCGADSKQGLNFANIIRKETEYANVPFLFTFNPKTKVDIRLRKFEHRYDILRFPLDSTELRIRVTRLMEAKEKVLLSKEPEPKATEVEEISSEFSVLLVEDNPLNQKVLGMFIAKLGLAYDVASNGQMAVDLSGKVNYKYILMDIYMPGMDGTEATVKIRENEQGGNHRAKIIAITANESEESVKRCYDSGMDDYLVKPFTLEVLKEKLV